MPRIEIQVKHLGSKKFRNKKSVIEIEFYEHEMAEASVERKRSGAFYRGRWRNARRFAYIPFDTCKVESIYDYNDCLDVLKRDKVARRWFIREMRHCTKNLIQPNGKIDMEHVQQVEDDLFHRTKASVQMTDEQKAVLLEACPEAGYEDGLCSMSIFERMPEDGKRRRKNPKVKIIVKPHDFILQLMQKLSPDFYETAKRKRTIDNCWANIRVIFNTSDEWRLDLFIEDNDYVLYVKP